MRILALLLTAAALGAAADRTIREGRERPPEDRNISGPHLGLFFDSYSGRLRTAYGLPGAVRAGVALASNTAFASAAVSPNQNSALAIDTSGRVILVSYGAPVTVPVPDAPREIAFSPDGRLAALLYANAAEILVLRLESGAAAEAGKFAVPGEASLLAISNAGTALIADAEGKVLLLDGSGAREVATMKSPVAASFLSGGRAVIADGGNDAVYLLRNGELLPIAGGAQGIAEPVAVSEAQGGKRVLIANRRSGTVLSLGLEDGRTLLTFCGCRPDRMQPTAQPGIFWLAEGVLFDLEAPGRTWFAPVRGGGVQ